MRRTLALLTIIVALIFAAGQSFGQLTTTGAGKKPGGGGGGSVTFDAVGAPVQVSATQSQNYTGMTVGSISNGGLLAFIYVSVAASDSVSTAVWDSGGSNQSMSFLGFVATSSNNDRLEIWGLLNPISGNKTLAVSLAGGVNSSIITAALSFSGVNQASIAAAFPNFNSNTATAATSVSVTLTSGTGHLVAFASTSGTAGSVNTISGTQRWLSNAFAIDVAGATDTGAASVVASSTFSSGILGIAGVDVSP